MFVGIKFHEGERFIEEREKIADILFIGGQFFGGLDHECGGGKAVECALHVGESLFDFAFGEVVIFAAFPDLKFDAA